MNTGHSGSLSTGHANSAMDMVSRLETMVLMGMDMPLAAIQSQIASAIDIIIQLGRIRDGSRKLLQVVEVKGVENGKVCLHELFRFREKKEQGTAILRIIRWQPMMRELNFEGRQQIM